MVLLEFERGKNLNENCVTKGSNEKNIRTRTFGGVHFKSQNPMEHILCADI